MICPKCGNKTSVTGSNLIPNGCVRQRTCKGCGEILYTTELIQENGAFYYAVLRKYHAALAKKRLNARISRVNALKESAR